MKLTPALLTMVMLLVVGSLVTAFVAKRMLAEQEVAQEEPISIPMALADLEPGTVITEAHLGLAPARPSQLDREVLHTSRVVVGRVVRNPIQRAQPIRTSDLYAPGERAPLNVAAGMRAISIALPDETSLIDGLIRPGQFADVHFTTNGNANARSISLPLFASVKVLAVNRIQSAVTVQGATSVTLELSPEQANIMLLASRRGSISLTYSPSGPGNGGLAVAEDQLAALNEVLGLATPVPPFVTEVISGADRSQNAFDGGRLVRTDGSMPTPAATSQQQASTQNSAGRSDYWNGRRTSDVSTTRAAQETGI